MNAIGAKNREAQKYSAKRWHVTSAAMAVALLAGGWSFSAQALVLGQIRVNSSLGEPLRAEVPVTQVSADEMSSLQVALADPNDFGGRGLIYNSSIASIQISHASTGRDTAVIRLTSLHPMQDPFIDVLVDVRWRTGNMQRSYTMLIDPPTSIASTGGSFRSAPAPVSVSVLQPPPSPSVSPGVTQGTSPAGGRVAPPAAGVPGEMASRGGTASPRPTSESRTPEATQPRPSQPRPAQPRPVQQNASSGDAWTVTVSRGQTLGQIAASMKPAGVSNEQMLIALLRANPSAFIRGNINWVRAGATLRIPSESEIAAISRADARRQVSAQAREFNEYRRNLAGQTTVAQRGLADNSGGNATSGHVTGPDTQASIAPRPEDVLTIDVGNNPQNAHVNGIVSDRQAGEISNRLEQVNENQNAARSLAEQVNNNGQGGHQVAVAPPQPSTVTPQPLPERPPVVVAQPPVNVPQQPPLVETQRPGVTLQPPLIDPGLSAELRSNGSVSPDDRVPPQVDSAPQVNPAPQPAALLEKDLIDQLMEEPWIPLGGLAVIGLIAFAGVKIVRRRREKAELDDDDDMEAQESTVDSFFANNLSQNDGEENMLDQSSSIYAASQLDTNADIDPVQEADVYLAYGHDEQAAEILRDALHAEPNRVALHAKLCEVYARQNKVNLFDEQASQLRALTSGQGPEWTRIAKLGHNISPANPLYFESADTYPTSSGGLNTTSFASQPEDNNQGFSSHFTAQSQHDTSSDAASGGFTSGQGADDDPFKAQPQTAGSEMQFETGSSSAATAQATGGNAVDYDLSDIFLDLPQEENSFSSSSNMSSVIPDDEEGPATRLALAEEFLAIGNKNDAKEIVQEVLSENPSDEVKKRAQTLLQQTN